MSPWQELCVCGAGEEERRQKIKRKEMRRRDGSEESFKMKDNL